MGRPSDFTPEMANTICERLADGESLRAICEDDNMPGRSTIRQWLAAHPEFALQYAHAREEQAHAYADMVVEAGTTATDAGLGRLKMDALKWAASKLNSKAYGDKVDLNHEGGITVEIVRFGQG